MICDACLAQPRNTHKVWMTYSNANPLSLPVFNFGAFPAEMEEDASVNKMRWKPKATPSGAQFSPLPPFCAGFTNLHTAFTFLPFRSSERDKGHNLFPRLQSLRLRAIRPYSSASHRSCAYYRNQVEAHKSQHFLLPWLPACADLLKPPALAARYLLSPRTCVKDGI